MLKKMKQMGFMQWVWLVEAFSRMVVVRLRIRFSQAGWLNRQLQFSQAPVETQAEINETIPQDFIDMHESVRLAARLQPGEAACLPRSLVLAQMLKWREHDAMVVIGVAKQGGQLASHAWVEVDSRIIGEPEQVKQDFKRLTR